MGATFQGAEGQAEVKVKELDQQDRCVCCVGPSKKYKQNVLVAVELLEKAAANDLEYGGDMLGEGVREGLMTAALAVLGQLVDQFEHPR